ncbi:RNA dependent RNA polymerase [Aspergillus saccharolyticus JOP 1030-1]|uniref:RNA-dependent RNA polymerase n=1 Tax=Aspergillus saccharolyticus JOP 1030-1 TaxID=1450539 RepID=A0A318ZM43_9EURO|nr:RNA-directed RNA polymerase (Sad-1) [Aspergillus saccharolyticus JOP 1030-1]PYH44920.1 RNA-directed RNA polymerase (Sad-1) [Aspergillus saccharolyticus JOP 1030-1]
MSIRSRRVAPGYRRMGLQPQAKPLQRPSPSLILPPWKSFDSLALFLSQIPDDANVSYIWRAFKDEGHIFSIDLFEDFQGRRTAQGKIRFRPPPFRDFWSQGTYTILLPGGKSATISVRPELNSPNDRIPSPVCSNEYFPVEIRIPLASLDFGVMTGENTFSPMRTIEDSVDGGLRIVLDVKARVILVQFRIQIFDSTNERASVRDTYKNYQIRIPFAHLNEIAQVPIADTQSVAHLAILESPPIYQRRIEDIRSTFMEDNHWRDADTWYRQTQIVHQPRRLSGLPVSLQRKRSVIDLGRWTAIKFNFRDNCENLGQFRTYGHILNDYNIKVKDSQHNIQFDDSKERTDPIWKWIDLPDAQAPSNSIATKLSSSLEFLSDSTYVHLPFAVRYQLEVCISNGYLSEFSMTKEFAIRLAGLEESRAKKLLEHVATEKKRYYDPLKIFNLKFIKGVTDAKIPPYCCYMRSARITPTTIYFSSPTVDISNRIIRRYAEHTDRFLRVRFTDEKLLGRINSTMDNTKNEVFTRIKRALANGIVVGDRHYEFLAFGNSQFREHGAYFFAPLPGLTTTHIRAWMGHFSHIRNVAKHAARLGQCFSTTRAIAGCPVQVQKIDDVERNGYVFSDGVGRISRFLAQMAMTELKIKTPSGDPPSAYQFRLGGCKGMLVVSPEAQPQEVHIRESQRKFSAIHNNLEIIRWSQFGIATLNRQLIIVLSTLGIPDSVFHAKLQDMLQNLDRAMESDTLAISLLRRYVDSNQKTLTVSELISDGFMKSREPFLTSVLTLWRAWHLKYLKEKAKIVIEQGANLLGCMDETGVLKGFYSKNDPKKNDSLEKQLAALPEIFLQITRPEAEGREDGKKYTVIEGVCILARNPSLHPGDIRVVRAVNVPQLHNLHDVVVLPQTGDRDIASMCSGGDLDGDDYLVIWDQDLLPEDWFQQPMKYTSNRAPDLNHDVTVDEITSFFVTYMKHDCLPRIAHAHLAWADRMHSGVNDDKCIQLAHLHSDAVDYNKTGIPATMTRNLQPHMWPHFMEKKGKAADKIYHSRKILGQLYDAVERVDFTPSLEMPFDKRILNCKIPVDKELYQFAQDLKAEYDTATRRIMAQHEIKTEFEVWSTFVLDHANMSKDYKFHEEIGAITMGHLEGFKKKCYDEIGGRNSERLAPLVLAMYRVTHSEMAAALNEHREASASDGTEPSHKKSDMSQWPLISFPWIFPHVLGKLAKGLYDYEEPEVAATDEAELTNDAPTAVAHQAEADNVGTEDLLEDPFGLFEGETMRSTVRREQNTSTPQRHKENVQSLEELLDFGLSDPRQPSALSTTEASDLTASLLEVDGNVAKVAVDAGKCPEQAQIIPDNNSGGADLFEEEEPEPNELFKLATLLGN